MGTPHPPEESILFVAILYSNNDLADRVLSILGGKYGDVLIESPEYPWDHSDYYDEEIGSPIFRRFIFYRKPFDPLTLPDVKLETNAIEHEYSVNGKRLVNIDPGYLMSSRVVLASAKDYSHRIYLGKGIYGELSLYYQGRSYQPLPYTYQDYKSDTAVEMFGKARKEFKKIVKRVR